MKLNPIGGQIVTTPKQEPIHYVNTRGRQNQQYNQNNQRGSIRKREIFAADHIHLDHKTQGSTISTTMKHKIQTMFQMWKSVWPESSTILSGKRQKLFKMQ